MRILRLNEQEFINVIMESTRRIILEDKRRDQARKKTMAIIQQSLGNSVDVQEFLKKFEDDFYHESVYRDSPLMRLEPMICRFAIEADYGQDNQDNEKIQKIKSIMGFLYKISANKEFDLSKISLDTSFDEFNNTFSKMIDDKANAGVEERKKKQYVRDNSYKIIGPVDFKTAHEYGKWSYPKLKLCYTTDETKTTWNKFTNNGFNNAYIIVKDGFENIKPVHDDDSRSPYDTYGVSMMFVFVDGNGKISNSNVRWNHEANFPSGFSVDNALDENMISDLVGVNFESVFKPNNKWKEFVNNVVNRLRNGESPRDVFDWVGGFNEGFARVLLGNKFNFIREDNHELLSKNLWFNEVYEFNNGFAEVKLGNKREYIDVNGKLYTEEEFWTIISNNINSRLHKGESPRDVFDWIGDFRGGFAKVKLDNKYNFIREDNNQLLSKNLWFSDVYLFKNGFARVRLGYKWKYIDVNGKLYTDQEAFPIMAKNAIIRLHNGESPRNVFNGFGGFRGGFAKVTLQNKYNFIREDGTLLREDLWFDDAYSFKNGVAEVQLGEEYKYIDTNGELYTEQEGFSIMVKNIMIRLHKGESPIDVFDWIGGFCGGFAKVKLDNKYNFIREDNNQLLSKDRWFNAVDEFNHGCAHVQLGEEWKIIDTNGKLHTLEEGFNIMVKNAMIRLHKGENPREIFDTVDRFCGGFARIELCDNYNFIRKDNNELLRKDLWFNEAYDFKNGFAYVQLDEEWKIIDTNGKLHTLEEGFNIMVKNAMIRLHNGENPKDIFDYIGNFNEGFIIIGLCDKFNFLREDNYELLSENLWFDYAYNFDGGFALIKLGNEYKYIDTEGNLHDNI